MAGLISLLAAPLVAATLAAPPEPGIVARGRVVDVYDGDTITVEFTFRARVRILDLWCPEVRGGTAAEKAAGIAARDRLRQLVDGKPVTLHVPTEGIRRLDDVFTFGRVLGHVWTENGIDVGRVMREEGHGTRTKKGGDNGR